VRNDFHHRDLVETSFDRDRTFMLVEIDGDRLYFQTISHTGRTVDSGEITRQGQPAKDAATKPMTQMRTCWATWIKNASGPCLFRRGSAPPLVVCKIGFALTVVNESKRVIASTIVVIVFRACSHLIFQQRGEKPARRHSAAVTDLPAARSSVTVTSVCVRDGSCACCRHTAL
jgi:hypothetical protein